MHLNSLHAILLLSSFSFHSLGAPLPASPPIRREHLSRRAAPYSVVAVDGGSSETSTASVSPEVRTVTKSSPAPAATSPQSSPSAIPSNEDAKSAPTESVIATNRIPAPSAATETVVSTMVISESASLKTIIVTVTPQVASNTGVAVASPSQAAPWWPPAVASAAGSSPTSWIHPSGIALPTGTAADSADSYQRYSSYPSWNSTKLQGRSIATAAVSVSIDSPLEHRSVAAAPTGSWAGAAVTKKQLAAPSAGTWNDATMGRRALTAGAPATTWNDTLSEGQAPAFAVPDAAAPTSYAARRALPTGYASLKDKELVKTSSTEKLQATTITSSSTPVDSSTSSAASPTLPTLPPLTVKTTNPTEIPAVAYPTHESKPVPTKLPEHLIEMLGIASNRWSKNN